MIKGRLHMGMFGEKAFILQHHASPRRRIPELPSLESSHIMKSLHVR
jgi:hypothetical protein